MRTMKKSCIAVLMAVLVAFSVTLSVCLMPQQAQAQILNPDLQEEPYSDSMLREEYERQEEYSKEELLEDFLLYLEILFM